MIVWPTVQRTVDPIINPVAKATGYFQSLLRLSFSIAFMFFLFVLRLVRGYELHCSPKGLP